jgi:hypothetical protein
MYGATHSILIMLLLAAQHVRQLVFTHKLGQRQASVVLAARVVEVSKLTISSRPYARATASALSSGGGAWLPLRRRLSVLHPQTTSESYEQTTVVICPRKYFRVSPVRIEAELIYGQVYCTYGPGVRVRRAHRSHGQRGPGVRHRSAARPVRGC